MATITSPRPASPAIPVITSPSAVSTPTSSVRASLDLPSNPASQNNTANPAQRRNRAALRDYYNLKAKPAPSPSPGTSTTNLSRTASITSTTSNSTHLSNATLTTDTGGFSASTALPSTLDDPSFDAEAYIATLLKTSSLRDILRTESTLVSEIRNLDGERKALVYDNYSKLIIAVGTIGDMQRGIVDERTTSLGGDRGGNSGLAKMKGLEGKLDELMTGFREAGGGYGEGHTGDQRAKVSQRRNERAERKKKELVRWVLDAPSRLAAMVEEGNKNEAEQEWQEVEALLTKWEGVEGTEKVRDDCKKALQRESDAGE